MRLTGGLLCALLVVCADHRACAACPAATSLLAGADMRCVKHSAHMQALSWPGHGAHARLLNMLAPYPAFMTHDHIYMGNRHTCAH